MPFYVDGAILHLHLLLFPVHGLGVLTTTHCIAVHDGHVLRCFDKICSPSQATRISSNWLVVFVRLNAAISYMCRIICTIGTWLESSNLKLGWPSGSWGRGFRFHWLVQVYMYLYTYVYLSLSLSMYIYIYSALRQAALSAVLPRRSATSCRRVMPVHVTSLFGQGQRWS